MPRRQAEAYGLAQKTAFLPRQVEASAFAKAAALLGEARGRVQDFDTYREALRFNRLVWTLIQADMARSDHGLSDEVKARFLSLSIFVDKQTVAALAAPSAAWLEPLIQIDRSIAQGLWNYVGHQEAADGRDVAPPSSAIALSA